MFLLFLAPFSWGTRYARGRCSQSEWVLYGRDLCRSGGTGKAEAAKLPGAGIGPKPCPRKCATEKGYLPDSVRIGLESMTVGIGQMRKELRKQSTSAGRGTARSRRFLGYNY